MVDQVRLCRRARQVIVAADDQRIVQALAPFGTVCVMTRTDHASGTDRVAEVAAGLGDEIIVNVQGDEPEISPDTVDGLIGLLEESGADMVTAAAPFPPGADVADPNLVKVVVALDGRAVYFSRSVIPFRRDADSPPPAYLLHLGVYAYRREFLLQYAAWPPTPCERAEKLEQLRAIEHGRDMRVLTVSAVAHGIDTPAQYARFVERWRQRQQGWKG